MSSIIALLLALQAGYSTPPATQPAPGAASQPALQPANLRQATDEPQGWRAHEFQLPGVYSGNYATRFFGMDDKGVLPGTEVVPRSPANYGSSPQSYYGPYSSPYYYYPFRSFRSTFFTSAPFVRGNLFNPSPFFRSPGQPGQITPRPMMSPRPAPHRGGGGGGGGRGGRR
jgi:hypothetical protein